MKTRSKAFSPISFIERKILEIKNIVGHEKVVAAVSGGVDSTTSAVLVHKAIGNQLSTIFIDTGLMKKDEPKKVIKKFKELGIKIEYIDAKKYFLKALNNVTDPEAKKQIFRNLLYSIIFRYMINKKIKFLVQGVISTDFPLAINTFNINSLKKSKKIFKITTIEPLRSLLKEDVRKVAKSLGIKDYKKTPFPGMGFAVRVVGEVTKKKISILKKAQEIVEKETKKLKSFESFPVLLSDKITGIRKNRAASGYAIAIRIVTSKDSGKTAKFMQVPYSILNKIQHRILSEIPEVIHVFYSITNKPPATIELQYANFGLVPKGGKNVIIVKGSH